MFCISRPFYIRLLCFFLACLILANCFIIPVRASSLLYDVLAVTAENLIASLIRALGVYVSDGIKNTMGEGLAFWEDLCDYIVSKVPDKYLYVNAAGQTMIKMIFKDGLYYADRNLISLVLSYLTSPSGTSDGGMCQPIGYGFNFSDAQVSVVNQLFQEAKDKGLILDIYTRNLSKCYYIEFTKTTALGPFNSPYIVFTDGIVDFDFSNGILNVIVGSGHSIVLYRDQSSGTGDGMYRKSSASALAWSTDASSAKCTVYQGKLNIDLDTYIGPAPVDSINVDSKPSDIPLTWNESGTVVEDDRLGGIVEGLPVSVPDSPTGVAKDPISDVISGTKVECPSISVPVTGTDVVPDTDTSTQTGFWDSVLSWLKSIGQTLLDILSAVLSIPLSIVQPVVNAISEAVAAIKDFFTPSYDDLGFYSLPGLKDVFPFCIPFDLYAFMCVLSADPEAPVFTFACPLPGGGVYNVIIDLSAWNDVASMIRYAVIAIYIVSLANVTRKMIKW